MRTIFTIILLLAINTVYSQSTRKKLVVELISIESSVESNHHKHDFSHYTKDCSNEAESLITGFFIFYKNYVSSQDSRSCTFEPSCSVYSIETVKKNGIIVGLLDTFDRLTRCNGLSPEKYQIDPRSHLFIDYP